jgi:hypothetical protein
VRWTGIDDVRDALSAMRDRVDDATSDAVEAGIEIVHAAAVVNTTIVFREWTGALADSIEIEEPVRTGAHSWQARTYPTIVYGRIQELGGEIVAENATGFLWWEGFRSDGSFGLIKKHSVYLPPRPYLQPALDESREAMRSAASDAWASAIEV